MFLSCFIKQEVIMKKNRFGFEFWDNEKENVLKTKRSTKIFNKDSIKNKSY